MNAHKHARTLSLCLHLSLVFSLSLLVFCCIVITTLPFGCPHPLNSSCVDPFFSFVVCVSDLCCLMTRCSMAHCWTWTGYTHFSDCCSDFLMTLDRVSGFVVVRVCAPVFIYTFLILPKALMLLTVHCIQQTVHHVCMCPVFLCV